MNNLTPVPEPMLEKYKPSRMEALRRYNISIRFLDRGVMVTVGCKEIAYESISAFLQSFEVYMGDPYKIQGEWEKFFNEQDQTK